MRTKNRLVPATFLLALLVLAAGSLQAQNATAPAARQDNASNQTLERLAVRTAKESGRTPIQIRHENTDRVGRRLVFHMRERFNESGLFRLSDREEEKIVLHVKTRTEFPDRPGISSIYALTWTFSYGGDVLSNYLRSRTGIAGSEALKSLAEELAAQTQEISTRYSYLFEEDQ